MTSRALVPAPPSTTAGNPVTVNMGSGGDTVNLSPVAKMLDNLAQSWHPRRRRPLLD
jgi:hypothetical protein